MSNAYCIVVYVKGCFGEIGFSFDLSCELLAFDRKNREVNCW